MSGTDDGLDELRALSDAATPGPWWADVPGFGTIFQDAPTHGERKWLFDPRDGTTADATLIVAVVNYVRRRLATRSTDGADTRDG